VGLWHDLKVRLGLEDDWDDEYYEDEGVHEPEDEDEAFSAPSARRSEPPYQSPYGSGAGPGAVRRLDRGPDLERARSESPRGGYDAPRGNASLRSVPAAPAPSAAPGSANMKMHIVEPKSFTEAQSIGDKFKQGTPVIMNMTSTTPDLAKRLLDFASGLTYGLEGGLQKVSERVFMLTPHNVDVSDADRRRLRDTGLFRGE
jgi:cell division inhibitor SepF